MSSLFKLNDNGGMTGHMTQGISKENQVHVTNAHFEQTCPDSVLLKIHLLDSN
jgi:hypothetical protein